MAVKTIPSKWMYQTSPIYSTNIRIDKKSKRTCGLVPFPDYSCEDFESQTTLSNHPTSPFKEETSWKPEEELFGLSVPWKPVQTIFDKKVTLKTKKVSVTLPKFRPVAISTSIKNKTPKTDQDKASITVQNETSTIVHDKTNVTVKYKGGLSKVLDLNKTRHFLARNQSKRTLHNKKNRNAARLLSSKVTARRSVTGNHALFLRQVITTLSTYPPFPDGSIPTKMTEPTEVLMCGIAKCLMMDWVDSEAEDPKKTTKKKMGLLKTFKATNRMRAPEVDASQDVFSDTQSVVV